MTLRKKIVLAVVVIACTFIGLEVIQRIRYPTVGFRNMTNSMGFRSPEFDPKKAEDTTRILFLGGSTTFGVDGPVKSTFPYIVGEVLRQQLSGKQIETINAAQPGRSSYGVVERIQETLYLDPDILIVMTGYNDAVTIYSDFIDLSERGHVTITSWYYKVHAFLAAYSVFYVTLREKISILIHGVPDYVFEGPRDWEDRDPSAVQQWFDYYPGHFANNLERMIKIAHDRNIKIIFVKPPLSPQRRRELPLYRQAYESLIKVLVQLTSNRNVPLIHLSSFDDESVVERLVGHDGLHFSEEGNRRIAEDISAFLLDRSATYFH